MSAPISVPPHAPQAAREFLAAQTAYDLASAPINAGEPTDEERAAFRRSRDAMYSKAYVFALVCAREIAEASS